MPHRQAREPAQVQRKPGESRQNDPEAQPAARAASANGEQGEAASQTQRHHQHQRVAARCRGVWTEGADRHQRPGPVAEPVAALDRQGALPGGRLQRDHVQTEGAEAEFGRHRLRRRKLRQAELDDLAAPFGHTAQVEAAAPGHRPGQPHHLHVVGAVGAAEQKAQLQGARQAAEAVMQDRLLRGIDALAGARLQGRSVRTGSVDAQFLVQRVRAPELLVEGAARE